jgi:hypothetical protein
MDTTSLERSIDGIGDRVRPRIEEARKQLERFDGRARRLINEHPAACLLGALALGYLVARVARRQRS